MTGQALPPVRCGPASTATPASPTPRPNTRRNPSRCSPPVKRSRIAAMIGEAAISRPVIELVRWRSASDSRNHAAMISKNAKPSSGFQCRRTILGNSARQRERQQHRRTDGGPREHQDGNRHALDGDLDHQIRDAPDDAHRDEQQPSARAHLDHITRAPEASRLRGDRETLPEFDLPAGSRGVRSALTYRVGRDNCAYRPMWWSVEPNSYCIAVSRLK